MIPAARSSSSTQPSSSNRLSVFRTIRKTAFKSCQSAFLTGMSFMISCACHCSSGAQTIPYNRSSACPITVRYTSASSSGTRPFVNCFTRNRNSTDQAGSVLRCCACKASISAASSAASSFIIRTVSSLITPAPKTSGSDSRCSPKVR